MNINSFAIKVNADARHRVAQATGRDRWSEYYKMDVAEIIRVSNFERPPETVA